MAKPGTFQKGADPRRSDGGLTKARRAEREIADALLLTPAHDVEWLEAYMGAVKDRVAPIVLDYTYRRLGKPPESINVTDDRSNELLEMLKAVPPEDVLKFLDATKDEK